MCSIGEDDFGDEGGVHAMVKDEQLPDCNSDLKNCIKCGTQGPLIKLKFRDAECTTCFLAYARHKFRAALGSSKILPKGAKVLLLFDGSAESLVLLDMMSYSQTQNTHKRLHVNTKVLFMDESSIDEPMKVREFGIFLSKYNFETFVISLADKNSLRKMEDLESYIDSNWKKNDFAESVKSLKSLTSRQDFLKIHRSRLIKTAADQLNCDFVFLPDISSNLAAELLNSISLGRGGSAALDVSLLDDRFAGLKIIRPLRTLNADEVNFYLKVNNLKAIKSQSFGETLGPNSSIQNLTKRFVEDLQSNFSSTVSTVFRTGDKISTHISKEDSPLCSFCNTQLDYTPSTTLLAIEFSRFASSLSGNLEDCEEQVIQNEKMHSSSVPENLCHSCSNMAKDCTNVNLLQQ